MGFNNEIFQIYFYSLIEPFYNNDKITSVVFKWDDPEDEQGYPDSNLLETLTDASSPLKQLMILETTTQYIFLVYFKFEWNGTPLTEAYSRTTPKSEKVFQFLSGFAIVLLDKDKSEIMRIDSSPHHRELEQTFPFHFHEGKKNKRSFEPTSKNIVNLLLEYMI